jgi:hypothetical protein
VLSSLGRTDGAAVNFTNTRHIDARPSGHGRKADGIDGLAASLGVHIARHRTRAGDPARFRFFTEASEFHSGDGLGTVIGPRNALVWLGGFQAARPLRCERETS